MSALQEIFSPVLLASRDAAFLIVAVAVLLLLVFRRLAPAWRHLLWMLVVVRLLLPALPESALSWKHWAAAKKPEAASSDLPVLADGADRFGALDFSGIPVVRTAVSGPPAEVVKGSRRWTLREILPALWAGGALIWLSVMGAGWISFQRRVKRLELRRHPRREDLETMLTTLCAELRIARAPRLLLTDAVAGPALTGWWRPRILMPGTAVEGLSPAQLRMVILHELGHLRRRDVAVNWLLCLLQALHWFNPLVWWAFRRIRIEAERATDEWVLRRIDADAPAHYGETLIRLLEFAGSGGYSSPGLVGVVESRFSLRSRLAAIGCYRGTARPWLTAAAAVVVSGIAAVGLTQAPAKKSAEPPPQALEGAWQDAPRFGEGAQVELSVKLWRLREGQPDELIATPTAVTMPGQWVLFEDSSEIRYPTAYGLPALPETLAAKAKGGGTVSGGEDATKWAITVPHAVLPPHPTEYEKRSLGWTLKLRPHRANDGTIRVAGVIEQIALEGFANHGIPITVDQPSGLLKRVKTRTATENRQLLPVFLERNQELRFEPLGDRLVATVMADAEGREDEDARIVEGFGDSLREAGLPGIRVEVLARPVELESVGKRDAQGGASESVYVMTRFLETDVKLSDEDLELAGLGSTLITETQFHTAIRTLNARKGIHLLNAPSLALSSGESGLFELLREFHHQPNYFLARDEAKQLEVGSEFVYPLDYDPPLTDEQWKIGGQGFAASPATPISFATVRLGLQLQVKANVLPDGWIELDLSPRNSDFREFLDFGGQIRYVDDGKISDYILSENRIVMPVFDASSQRMTVRVPNNHTLVLGGLVRDYESHVEDKLPVIGLVTDSKRVVERRFLYIFVTPQLMD